MSNASRNAAIDTLTSVRDMETNLESQNDAVLESIDAVPDPVLRSVKLSLWRNILQSASSNVNVATLKVFDADEDAISDANAKISEASGAEDAALSDLTDIAATLNTLASVVGDIGNVLSLL